jgi:hypothetical protein
MEPKDGYHVEPLRRCIFINGDGCKASNKAAYKINNGEIIERPPKRDKLQPGPIIL